MRKTLLATLLVAAGAGLVTSAAADKIVVRQVQYVGIHPVAESEGGGICYIEGPHVHVYAADKLQYREHEGRNYFVGDPVAYGYEGPKYAYKGHHPIHVEAVVGGPEDVEYCYLDGPHYHYFQPPPGPEFTVAGDAYFYVAPPPRVYLEARPMYVGINAVYAPRHYHRPVVEVAAPVGWIGAAVVAPGVVVGGGVAVGVGAAIVAPPPPSVHVGIGVNVGVGVGVGVAPATVIVREKHDNGRHRGHRK